MIDAAMQAFRMLRNRPGDRRRILLLISETRDNSSENKVREVLVEAQLNNTVVYSVNINRLITTLTARPQPARPDPFPAGARLMLNGRPVAVRIGRGVERVGDGDVLGAARLLVDVEVRQGGLAVDLDGEDHAAFATRGVLVVVQADHGPEGLAGAGQAHLDQDFQGYLDYRQQVRSLVPIPRSRASDSAVTGTAAHRAGGPRSPGRSGQLDHGDAARADFLSLEAPDVRIDHARG